MPCKNQYEDIAYKARKQLDIAAQAEVWAGKSSKPSLSYYLCKAMEEAALESACGLLRKLPQENNAFAELTKKYEELQQDLN